MIQAMLWRDQLEKLLHDHIHQDTYTAQKMKFSIKDIFSKCDRIHSFLRIWSHLLEKSLMENFILLCSIITQFFNRGHKAMLSIMSFMETAL